MEQDNSAFGNVTAKIAPQRVFAFGISSDRKICTL
jgi:hypothetical protein